jgi:hypothetical protein
MAFAPSAFWNSRSITHLANYLSPSLPMNSSDESKYLRMSAEELWELFTAAVTASWIYPSR